MIEKIRETLKKYWGYDEFMPLQREAMLSVLEGRDSIVVLPTGGGKSLCFQAPAMVMPGIAIVVSPLISLMKDQVDGLCECGVRAARIDSSLHPRQREAVMWEIDEGSLRILYVSPERMLSDGFLDFLKKRKVSLIAVDEAHCVSMWGHDFRPEYRQLGVLKDAFPGVGIHAYTATATERVSEDIGKQLRLVNPEVLVGSFDRANLIYKVERRNNALSQVREILDRHKGESGIVYCIKRDDVDWMCQALSAHGYKVAPYHAGMTDEDRKRNQDAFMQEETDTIVATVAFGMGIDKSNVRYVVHAGMPKSLEHYQQESGRAGRDGLEAECCLFYSAADFMVWNRIMGDMEGDGREIALDKLRMMLEYCTGVTCRRKVILNYFGQDVEGENCGGCDVCTGDVDYVEDALPTAQKILSCVVRLGQGFGADYTAMVLNGSNSQRITANGHEKLSTYGLLSDQRKTTVRDWIEQLMGQGFLKRVHTGDYSVLQVTEKGWTVIRGGIVPRLSKPPERTDLKPATPQYQLESWEGVDKELFEALRVLRREIADSKAVPAYIVFGDEALRDMARRRPSTPEGFLQVRGVGEMKCEQYGARFLGAIKDYCSRTSTQMDVAPHGGESYGWRSVEREKRENPSPARQAAFMLFERGHGPEEIAEVVGRAVGTVYTYLSEYIRDRKIDDPSPWVDKETAQRIVDAAGKDDSGRLKPIFDLLNGEVPYEKIRVCLNCLQNAADKNQPKIRSVGDT